jgi:hypothetical protein
VLERDTIGSPRASQLKSRRTHEGRVQPNFRTTIPDITHPCWRCSTMRWRSGSLKPENRALVLAGESPADLLQALEEWRPVRVEKWLSRETR